MQTMIVNGATGAITIEPIGVVEAAEIATRLAVPRTEPVHKRVLVERLDKVGLLRAAFQALGGPGSLQYERWSASTEVDPTNPDVLALLRGIGGDTQSLLRPGDEV